MRTLQENPNKIVRELNIENTPRCTLECSMCKRTTYFDLHKTKVIPGKDLTPDEFRKCLKFFHTITFGGQLSDPIFNKHFIELLEICKEYDIRPKVLTAATGRKEDWYKKAFLACPEARWTFGIDGPPHLSHKYRVNQNGGFLYKMMLLAKSMGIKTYWQYIIFKYNEEYVEECKKMAEANGIRMEFLISQRDVPEHLKPSGRYG
tara:strand:- start:554 stop:1168 length:615 start_codon:yes stop_codon:yes gene_type:complete